MATVVVASTARAELARLIASHDLPADTRDRVREALALLAAFPRIGRTLTGRWKGLRVILGPWSWMLLVYVLDDKTDTVTIVAIHDARSAGSATSER